SICHSGGGRRVVRGFAEGAGGGGVVLFAVARVGQGGCFEAAAAIDPPQLLERLVVERDYGAVEQGGDDDPAGGAEHAGEVGIGQVDALLHLAGGGIEHHDARGDALRVDVAAARELAFHVRAVV